MSDPISRRNFLQVAGVLGTGALLAGLKSFPGDEKEELFRISLAEWSVNRMIFGKAREKGWEEFGRMLQNDFSSIEKQAEMTNLQFPVFARSLGFDAVEYVNTCFFDKARNTVYLTELKNICRQEGISSLLIMCDNEGMVGHREEKERLKTLENHKKWIDAAAFLGCHSIRVNAASQGSFEEQQKLASEGLHLLCEYGDSAKINILVENHGGLSSNAEWLAGVMQLTAHKRVGTLPDFGNFRISPTETYDRYRGVEMLMPWAKGVSAKSHAFDKEGNETQTDFYKMIKIVLDSGFRGTIDVEYEGDQLSEKEGIIATKKLLEKAREQYPG
jgi:sugar phosphate isomerase/epimerase